MGNAEARYFQMLPVFIEEDILPYNYKCMIAAGKSASALVADIREVAERRNYTLPQFFTLETEMSHSLYWNDSCDPIGVLRGILATIVGMDPRAPYVIQLLDDYTHRGAKAVSIDRVNTIAAKRLGNSDGVARQMFSFQHTIMVSARDVVSRNNIHVHRVDYDIATWREGQFSSL